MTERSINYHFGTFDIPFADIKHVGKEAHHTANDVFLAAVGEGLGLYHKKLGKPVDKLRVNMPVSTRGSGDGVENAVNIARFELPTVLDESRNVMDQVSKTVRKMRDEPAMAFANQLGELSRFIPSEIVAAAAQASDVTASNVPGVPVPVWLAGARVTRMYPLVATIGAAVNITLLTYNGTASVGISTDDAAVSEPELMLEALRQGFADVIGKHVPATSPLSVGNSESRTTIAQTAPTGTADETQAKPKSVKRTAKTVAKRAPAKKTVVKKAPTKKTVVKKAPAKKTVVKRTPTKKTVVKKAPAKKTVVKRTPTKQTVAKRAPAKKAPAKKATKRQ
jgi:hypothetical protein